MAAKRQVLRLVGQGHGYDEVGRQLGIPPGQAYLIATGIAADGGDMVTRRQRQRLGMLPSRTQRLVNPREQNPTAKEHGVLRADRDGGYTPLTRAVRVLVHAPDGAVEEHRRPRDDPHWRLGGTK